MKFRRCSAVLSVLMLMGFSVVPTVWADDSGCVLGVSTVSQCFPDSDLAGRVAYQAGIKVNDVLTMEAASSITYLWTKGSNLHGISELPNLTQLSVGDREEQSSIRSLNGIEGSRSLTTIQVTSGHDLVDISALRAVPNLQHVDFYDVGLTTVSGFYDMPRLEDLSVVGTYATDVYRLQNLPSLRKWRVQTYTLERSATVSKGGRFALSVPLLNGKKPDSVGSITNDGVYDAATNQVSWTEGLGWDSDYMFYWSTKTDDGRGRFGGSIKAKLTVTEAPNIDRTKLSAAIKRADVLNEQDYVQSTWVDMKKAYNLAVQYIKRDDIDQSDVDNATAALNKCIDELTPVEGSIAYLQQIVGWYSSRIESEYTEVTWRPFARAMKDAKAILAKSNPTKDEISQVTARLDRFATILRQNVATNSIFTDVNDSTPHVEDIRWLSENFISTGWNNHNTGAYFAPRAEVTRQDMAAFLYRLAGEPEYEPTDAEMSRFSDVNQSTPHWREVLWLASTGIATGYSDGTFGVGRTVIRQDMAAFLWRFHRYLGGDDTENWYGFSDIYVDTPHADEIGWLSSFGIVRGYPDGTFRPRATVIRQDMAAFFTSCLGAELKTIFIL
ncbi:S-layer homology domain-containing protein [Bifidobacterium miconisargentati]|uniref:S-layer homology domain-containing protein n=1 Tax=Bifidobacterium miconisargentati TaxID=2834437 RepID=UPI001BDD25CE|nr:S-layer homology domain-containing protein [Bifidobacterium miconisargentati]MBW3091343.1 S-layer homology domain-containing protein [Bifidobacterium miconisargentati]